MLDRLINRPKLSFFASTLIHQDEVSTKKATARDTAADSDTIRFIALSGIKTNFADPEILPE